ncbi:MAG: S41 family peptidase [Gammaproteobacteria bacterium]
MKKMLSSIVLATLPAFAATVSAETLMLRYPDVHGDRIVFTYAGDLWIATTKGGQARQLTSHPGLEFFAEFSPGGREIAFTGQYDGAEQVYVMPTSGGEPRQLTHYPSQGPLPARWGYDHLVQGWSPDGQRILFRSLRDAWGLGDGRLFTVKKSGGLPEPLPLPRAGAATFAGSQDRIFYSPLMRDFRTWKRYQGGWAQDLYLLDIAERKATQITDHARSDRDPMWIDGVAYFASDRDGRFNLYRHDPSSGKTTQLTRHTDSDVRWPGTDGRRWIVYELNGALHLYDTEADKDRRLTITVPSDQVPARPRQVDVAGQIESFALSPRGRRALFVARGDLFSVPVEKGVTVNLTGTSDAHEREVAWSADGSRIAYVSDESGEEEVYVRPSGGGEAVQVSAGYRTRYSAPVFSPDGKRLAWHDASGRIFVARSDGRGKPVVAADEAQGDSDDYAWSPDGRWLAFSLSEPSGLRSIHVWDSEGQKRHRITDEFFNDRTPAWSPDGKTLYFLGDRMFQPQIGSREFNYTLVNEVGIIGLALSEDAEDPFGPEDADPVIAEEATDDDGESAADEEAAETPEVSIDFDGLSERYFRVPGITPTNIQALAVTGEYIHYVVAEPFFYGREPLEQPRLMVYSLEDRESKELAGGLMAASMSPDGGFVMIQGKDGYRVYDVSKGAEQEAKPVATDKLVADIDPREEWRTIFAEVWRRFRDYFYVENMHGLDWQAVRAQYEPLLKHVSHRSDLNYLIGEMIAELNASHAYVAGGDEGLAPRPNVALLGARFELDAAAGRYRIVRIFPGENDSDRYRSPLTEVGIDVQEGDYLLAVNGRELTAGTNPYELLAVPAGQPVRLTVGSSPDPDDARAVLVEPLASESDLIYLDWVAENRRKVAAATDGRVGYLHIPDMGANGIREFIKWYYPQIRRDGLVVDVRSNGGGNVSQMLIERLRRNVLGITYARHYDRPGTYPAVVFPGHLVCLINETSASDGDIFPWMFREAGLGPLIGKRTWGGVIGITGHGPVLDGGSVFVPQFGYANAEGEYDVEGEGVSPDIEVENDPVALLEGRDPQLERGIAEVMQKIAADPPRIPSRPADPVRTD